MATINWYSFKSLPLPLTTTTTKEDVCRNVKSRYFTRVYNSLQAKQQRRSANYHPNIWDPKFIASLNTPYNDDLYGTKLGELKHKVKTFLVSSLDPCDQLRLIDVMQRLGVAYHFKEEIFKILNLIKNQKLEVEDLNTVALYFRISRQNSIIVDSDIFERFRDRNGKFMEILKEDVDGLLSLYEASYLGIEGEEVLEEARTFSTQHLMSGLGTLEHNNMLAFLQVQRALQVPSYWRMSRIESRKFINIYQNSDEKFPDLLEFANLDYNIVQSVHQTELKELARWWIDLGFKEKLPFSRDRLVENYLWALGIVFERQFSKCRIGLTKFVCVLTAIDDMFDIYGSLDELEIFALAVERWEISEAMRVLPEYMKLCYLAMFNFVNELVYDIMKTHDKDILEIIKEEWKKLCRSYLVEARWFYSGYTPTFAEYIENSWISVGGPAAMVHASCMQLGSFNFDDPNKYFANGHELIYWSSLITRLCDDLGTAQVESKRGDIPKSVECYMIEKVVTEEEAKEHIKNLIRYFWKKMNEESFKSSSIEEDHCLKDLCLNMARTAQCIYQHGDGIGASTGETKNILTSLIVESVPIM